jgi:hypothetical protein
VNRIALVVVAGLATGILTQIGQGALGDDWSQVANTISPWLLVAFLVGSVFPDRRSASAAGVATLVLALVGYYAMTTLRFGIGGGTSSLLFWGTGALVGGAVFGFAGHAWRQGDERWRAAAIGLVAAVFVAEGVYQRQIRPDVPVGTAYIVVGALVPLVLGRSTRDRVGGYVAAVPALALGALGFVVFLRLYDAITGVV